MEKKKRKQYIRIIADCSAGVNAHDNTYRDNYNNESQNPVRENLFESLISPKKQRTGDHEKYGRSALGQQGRQCQK